MVDQRIQSFLKVYETKNITRAADELALTQPAVSKHIASLEEELGAKLFVRAHSRLFPTEEAKIAARYARRMINLEHNMRKEIRNAAQSLTGLSVGITHTAESNISTEALASFALSHGSVKLKTVSDTTDHLLQMIRDYRLDLAIIEGRVSEPQLRSIVLDTDSLVLAVPPEHHLASKNSVSIEDVKKENLILRSRHSGTRGMFVSSLESRNMHLEEFHVLMEIDNIAAIKDLIRRGFGVSVLARSTCEAEARKNKIVLLPIEDLSMMREMNLVYRKDFDRDQILTDIVKAYNDTKDRIRPN